MKGDIMWTYNYSNPLVEDELMHYGVKGMKWGVRRGRGQSGSTNRQQRKAAKKYKKEINKYGSDYNRARGRLSIDAYNKTADEYNNGKIQRFNKTHDQKSKTYMDDYNKQFSRDLNKNQKRALLDYMENNEHYKKAQRLCDKYDLVSVDELARRNADVIKQLRRQAS